jgi:glycosyltransferase involved in cell wall biosynthesis
MQAIKLIISYIETITILVFFFLITAYFYLGNTPTNQNTVIFSIVALSIMADGIFLFLHLPRKPLKHKKVSFDPSKLTVVIACYNGQDVIGDTILGALKHVNPDQIIVVSDASTDLTAETARGYGVQVVVNERNVNKAFSISFVMKHVKTPYVLVLDDDTLIGDTYIPTSLLDEGYDAVAFNVMPLETGTLVNKLQTFEYRKSMAMGKNLRGSVGAVGNISGAIGLYKTSDLMHQATRHSGQFGGEDQQRTSFVHLYGKGKGITYTDATVITKAPDTFKQLFKQRSFRWNLSLPELFFVYVKILFSPRFHYLLKAEKAYQMYLLVTDPIRMLFFWLIFFHPYQALVLYLFYSLFSLVVWFKIGRKDPIWLIFIFPIYSMIESICRFIAHFYWFKIKYQYIFKKKFHTLVPDRNLLMEYVGVFGILAFLWASSFLRLEAAISSGALLGGANSTPVINVSAADLMSITVAPGTQPITVAKQFIDKYVVEDPVDLAPEEYETASHKLLEYMSYDANATTEQTVSLDKHIISKQIYDAITEHQNI